MKEWKWHQISEKGALELQKGKSSGCLYLNVLSELSDQIKLSFLKRRFAWKFDTWAFSWQDKKVNSMDLCKDLS